METDVSPTLGPAAPPPVMERYQWDTRTVRREDQFAYYREGLCQSFMAVSPEPPATGSISALIQTVSGKEYAINRIDLSPHTIRRTKTDLKKMDDEFFYLSLYLNGEVHAEREAGADPSRREAGSLYFDKANVVSDFHPVGDKNLAVIGISLKSGVLYDQLGHHISADNMRIDRTSYTDALFSSLALLNKRFLAGSVDELNAIGVAVSYLLIAHVAKGPTEQKIGIAELSGLRGMVVLAKDHIDRELMNPALSLELIANRLGVSVRYLHKAFETEDQTFGNYVRSQRLDRIHAELLNPHCGDVAISDIAARWGMTDPTTFYRNFRGRFGDTPGQVRSLIRRAQPLMAR